MNNFYRIALASPSVSVGNAQANARTIVTLCQEAMESGASVVCFPELAMTGYTCGALFVLPDFARRAEEALATVVEATRGKKILVIVGLPVLNCSRLYDASAVIQNGNVLGVCFKSRPSLNTFDEARYFAACDDQMPLEMTLCGSRVPCGNDLLFSDGTVTFGIEIGHERKAVIPKSAFMASEGACIIFNPAAEPAVVGDNASRCNEICALSSRLHAVYASVGASCTESTGIALFSGHAIVAEDGKVLENGPQCERGGTLVCTEVNPAWMQQARRNCPDFNVSGNEVPLSRVVSLKTIPACRELEYREISSTPFVPEEEDRCCMICDELLRMQAASLAKRMQTSRASRLVIGLSGGLDSTVALLVCAECCDNMGLTRNAICAVTMPGLGTGRRTHDNARELALALGCDFREIPIAKAVALHFKDIGHDPKEANVVYENSQARERTQILMDLANEVGGIVVGTADLSEIALGWSTFNGDHMAMYGVNSGVPKTLLRAEATCYAAWAASVPKLKNGKKISECLLDIVDTPVSPELLPGGTQLTEKIIGDYALHDFFLYYFIRHGEETENLVELAMQAFGGEYGRAEIAQALKVFQRRFFAAQFKRTCAPEGARMTEVALDARGAWNMPADADAAWRIDK